MATGPPETAQPGTRLQAPSAEGLKLMRCEFGGFDATVLESALASTAALDTGWHPIQDGTAIAVTAEPTARVRPAKPAVPVRRPVDLTYRFRLELGLLRG